MSWTVRRWWLLAALAAATPGPCISPDVSAQPAAAVSGTVGHTALLAERNRQRNLAMADLQAGKGGSAVERFRQVLAIERRAFGTVHEEVVVTLKIIARVEESLCRYEQAGEALAKVLAIRKQLDGEQHWQVIDAKRALMDLHERAVWTPEQKQLSAAATASSAKLMRLYNQGKALEALEAAAEVLAIRKRLHAGKDHPYLATSLNNMGALLDAMGQSEKAFPFYQQALDMRQRLLKGQDHPDLTGSLNNMGTLLQGMGQYEKALPFYQQALDMNKRLYQDHPYLAQSLNNMGALLHEMGQHQKAMPFYQQALHMRQRLFKDQDHPDLAQSLNNVGALLHEMGQSEKALSFYQQALDMNKRLFKDQDHPDLAQSLNNMGTLLDAMGQYEKALPLYQQALDMHKRLFKDQDHPDLALSLNNLGYLLDAMGQSEKAMPFYQQALAMRQRLFKDQDHPDLAQSLNNMGALLQGMGQYEKALPLYQQALDMHKRLYQEHPDLTGSLINVGYLLDAVGQSERALPFYQQAHDMQRRLGDRFAFSTALADALDRVAQFPDSRSAFLATSRRLPKRSGDTHAVVWSAKATLAQLYRTRRQIARSRRSEQLDDFQSQLQAVQRRLSGLLSTPGGPERDRELATLTDRQQNLEQGIARLLPDWQPLAGLQLAQLHAALRPGDAFVDLYRYQDWAAQPNEHAFRYVVFVATAEGSRRVELGPAEAIDAAVTDWLLSIQRDAGTNRAADQVRRLLWEPIEAQLPSDTRRIFMCTDGDLGRVPFAALPGSKLGSILLERFAMATVESGPFLLDHLSKPRPATEGADTLLITGGIQYDPPGISRGTPWTFLPDSERELREVANLWGDPSTLVSASGHEATTNWLLGNLPNVRFAHLATHGQFDATEYAREQIRLAQAREHLFAGRIGEEGRTGLGVRNPLGYVGIVMAGANSPPKESPDRGLVAGTSIWPMDLSNLELVVLSACETGLGKDTGSAGVANLTLAFHVAGCKNVIASLWKVDDAATAALMAKFYHALWKENKPPLEALREAQLYVYHHPEVAMNWAAVVKRGKSEAALRAPKEVAAELPNGGKRLLDKPTVKTPLPERTPAKYWAAFTLSGIGE